MELDFLNLPSFKLLSLITQMVHMISQFFVLVALVASSCALNMSKRSTAGDVEADLKNISTQVTTLDNAIDSFPSSCSLTLALVKLQIFINDSHD